MTETEKKMMERLGLSEADFEGKKSKIEQLKAKLAATDYKAIKFAEGWISLSEYLPIKEERERIREQIRALEEGEEA